MRIRSWRMLSQRSAPQPCERHASCCSTLHFFQSNFLKLRPLPLLSHNLLGRTLMGCRIAREICRRTKQMAYPYILSWQHTSSVEPVACAYRCG